MKRKDPRWTKLFRVFILICTYQPSRGFLYTKRHEKRNRSRRAEFTGYYRRANNAIRLDALDRLPSAPNLFSSFLSDIRSELAEPEKLYYWSSSRMHSQLLSNFEPRHFFTIKIMRRLWVI